MRSFSVLILLSIIVSSICNEPLQQQSLTVPITFSLPLKWTYPPASLTGQPEAGQSASKADALAAIQAVMQNVSTAITTKVSADLTVVAENFPAYLRLPFSRLQDIRDYEGIVVMIEGTRITAICPQSRYYECETETDFQERFEEITFTVTGPMNQETIKLINQVIPQSLTDSDVYVKDFAPEGICGSKETVFEDNGNGISKFAYAYSKECNKTFDCRSEVDDLNRIINGGLLGEERCLAVSTKALYFTTFGDAFLNVTRTAFIADWGTVEQFIECTPPRMVGIVQTTSFVPRTWSYPPENLSNGSPSQSRNEDEATSVIIAALEPAKVAIFKAMPAISNVTISLGDVKPQEVLLFEDKHLLPDFEGRIALTDSEGLLVKSCNRTKMQKCLTEANYKKYTYSIDFPLNGPMNLNQIHQVSALIEQELNKVGVKVESVTFPIQDV